MANARLVISKELSLLDWTGAISIVADSIVYRAYGRGFPRARIFAVSSSQALRLAKVDKPSRSDTRMAAAL